MEGTFHSHQGPLHRGRIGNRDYETCSGIESYKVMCGNEADDSELSATLSKPGIRTPDPLGDTLKILDHLSLKLHVHCTFEYRSRAIGTTEKDGNNER